MATKSSILFFYLTLSKTHKVFRWATIATLVVVNVGGLALTLLNILQCHPVSAAFYTPIKPPQTCIDIVTIYLSSAPLNIITDLAIFFLPMPLLTGTLHLPPSNGSSLTNCPRYAIAQEAEIDPGHHFWLRYFCRRGGRGSHLLSAECAEKPPPRQRGWPRRSPIIVSGVDLYVPI